MLVTLARDKTELRALSKRALCLIRTDITSVRSDQADKLYAFVEVGLEPTTLMRMMRIATVSISGALRSTGVVDGSFCQLV